ncbi:MAG: hypothetical protein Ta2A_15460 [Treponemataceae bacterium]|nr:MAG: hypothetical protein Ta2A_15460 [Treponemataceae bacterium]
MCQAARPCAHEFAYANSVAGSGAWTRASAASTVPRWLVVAARREVLAGSGGGKCLAARNAMLARSFSHGWLWRGIRAALVGCGWLLATPQPAVT